MTKVTHLTLDERGSLSRKRIHLREISGEADAPLETVGQDLRAARLRRGDDLATVSRALKIRKDHLEALEEDRFEALPGRAYAVGFVRSYADYLGLDPLQCVERFKTEIAGRAEAAPVLGPAPEPETTVRLPQGWVVIGVVATILIIWVAYHLARSADTLLKQQAQMAAPQAQQASSPPPSTKEPAQLGRAMVASTPPAQATTLPQTPSNPPNTGLPTGARPTANLAQPPNNTQTATLPNQPGAPAAAPLPVGHAYGDPGQDVRVVLRATATTRILVQSGDGKALENRILQPGDTYRVPNRVGLTLTTPNGGAIGLELDGQPMGAAARGAQMTEALSLDPQAIVDRYNRNNPG